MYLHLNLNLKWEERRKTKGWERDWVIRLKIGANYFPFIWKKNYRDRCIERETVHNPLFLLQLCTFLLNPAFPFNRPHPFILVCLNVWRMSHTHVCTHTCTCMCNRMCVPDKRMSAKQSEKHIFLYFLHNTTVKIKWVQLKKKQKTTRQRPVPPSNGRGQQFRDIPSKL